LPHPARAGCAEDVTFTDLEVAVAVDLRDGDLRKPVVGEEGQQVVGDLVHVGGDRVRLELAPHAVEPHGGELVEARLSPGRLDFDLAPIGKPR
jgi:hypothetical protein